MGVRHTNNSSTVEFDTKVSLIFLILINFFVFNSDVFGPTNREIWDKPSYLGTFFPVYFHACISKFNGCLHFKYAGMRNYGMEILLKAPLAFLNNKYSEVYNTRITGTIFLAQATRMHFANNLRFKFF